MWTKPTSLTIPIILCMFLSRQINQAQSNGNVDNNKLQISRVIDDSYSQIHTGVQELAGQNLTLSCDLLSANNSAYDDQIAWGKATQSFKFKNESDLETLAKKKSTQMFAYFSNAAQNTQEVNRAVKTFTPLTEDDAGTYFCGSMRYMKFKLVHIIVIHKSTNVNHINKSDTANTNIPSVNWMHVKRKLTNFYCNDVMFKCKTGACISPHYVCDKKPDCIDGSDESFETCQGKTCENKIECDDGRCIPTAWCCDRHHDPNCTVTYRPDCCQLLSDAYDEPEYFVPYNMTQPVRQNGGRYVFITLCIVATFFSTLLLLLILGKIFMLAKRARCREARIEQLYQVDFERRCNPSLCQGFGPFVPRPHRARFVCPLPNRPHVNDALLVLSDDIVRVGSYSQWTRDTNRENTREEDDCNREVRDECPPSYTDVMSLEPPPPYTSQDCLNHN